MTNAVSSAKHSRARTWAYWIATVLFALPFGTGGVADVLLIDPVVEEMARLGYPAYFCVIIGVWKILGVVAVFAPRLPRLKEWAYAGIIFDLTGAIATHIAVSDHFSKMLAPIIFTILAVISWHLRPTSRRLGD